MRAMLLALLWSAVANAAVWPDLSAPPDAPPDAALDAAVLVGIEDYAFIPDVPGAALNLNDWYRDLRARGVPIDRITLLRDAQATREEMTEALRQGAARVPAGGRLWVVFIGHGAPGPGGDGLLVGVDAQQTPRSLAARGLRQTELLAAVAAAPAAVVLLDTCFSGRDAGGGALVPGLQPLVPVAPAAPPPQVVLLTAAASDQYAGPLPGVRRPAFSYLALGGLRGWADLDGDGRVTAVELQRHSRQVLDSLVVDRRQQPQLAGGTPGTVLSTRAEAGPDLDALRLDFAPRPAPGRPAPAGAATLRLVATDRGDRFQVVALGIDGARHACPEAVSAERPCTLPALPIGNARLLVDGDADVSQMVPLPGGATLVEIEPIPRWAMWTGLGTMLGGYVVMAVSGIKWADCSSATSSGCDSEGLYVTGLAVGAATTITGMSLLVWGAYKWFALDGEDLKIRHFPAEPAAVGVGRTTAGSPLVLWGGSF